MNPSDARIRFATFGDRDPILDVHRHAFGDDEGAAIAGLVAEMLADPTAAPIYSLVAEQEGALIGHILFTAVRMEPHEVSAQILAPLAVSAHHQRSGVGKKLIHTSLDHLRSNGVALVFVLGYPDYYSRFGFIPAGSQGFEAPYSILPKNADAWMVRELVTGAIAINRGTVRCCRALDQPQYWQE